MQKKRSELYRNKIHVCIIRVGMTMSEAVALADGHDIVWRNQGCVCQMSSTGVSLRCHYTESWICDTILS